jgi:hypothetical protein
MKVSGVNVPAGTTVTSVSGNLITLSSSDTASGTNQLLRFYSNGANYNISNLNITISQDVQAVLVKLYTNTNWVITPDSLLKYIADTSLYGGPLEGEMWWDYANPTQSSRAASVYASGVWASVNYQPTVGSPPAALDYTQIYVYCDGVLVSSGVEYSTQDYGFTYTVNATTGQFDFSYTPNSSGGKLRLPTITVSDILTTAYTHDISELVFSGIQYYFSPNVYDCETPLRLWKTEDLQVVETLAHLNGNNYANPLLADLNQGPGPDNWERYFVRLPPSYSRNETKWQKVNLICQDFGYWGSSISPEAMTCPPEQGVPRIYEELYLYGDEVGTDTFVYCEPYLYSNVGYFNFQQESEYTNSGIFPVFDAPFDEFTEADLVDYDPLHSRQAITTLPTGSGYGNWEGIYTNTDPCSTLTGFFVNDLVTKTVIAIEPPVWDASILKFPPTCEADPNSYLVDSNHYKVGYAYFSADLSCAEDGFFDPQQEASWRSPIKQTRTGYLVPG